MNNFYILIYLTKHLNNSIKGGNFQFSYSPHKNVWEAYIDLDSSIIRIIFSTNSSETALFCDKDRPHKKSNVVTFFDTLEGEVVTGISLADNDRIVSIHFESGAKLLFRVFGNKPNVFLIRNGIITESFKANHEYKGKKEPEPRAPNSVKKRPEETASPKQKITRLFPKFPRHLIPYITEQYRLEEKSVDQTKSILDNLITAMLERAEFRVLEDGNICLIPEDLLKAPTKKTFSNINDAVRFTYYETSRERRLSSKIRTLKPKLEQAIRKNESAIDQLSQADKGLERAEEYEQFGHILMAHAHENIDPGKETVTVSNFYDDGNKVNIPIKPQLSVAENAKRYYDKSTKAIRNVEESKRRLKEVKKENEELKQLLQSLNNIEKVYEFHDWYKEYEENLKQLGILAKTQQKEALPYRKTEIDNFEVWIGKNAKSNDRLTSDAHKEDVWLHARGVSGSHLVIRMNNNKEMPPKSVILKAAAVAAWNSKARGSKLAPVIVAKRKHISKPKGAPAGAVTVQKETVEMVKPQKLPS